VNLGTVTFDVPSGVKEGAHKFRAGVVQSHEERRFNPYTGVWYWYWVDDSVQYMEGYDEILIEELKAVLTIVSVAGLPALNRPIYVGETSTIVVVVSNSGNARAQAVKVLLEDLSSATSLVVTSADSPKDLDAGAIDQWKIDVRGQQPGTYTGRLRIYAGNQRILEQPWKLEVAAPEIRIVRKELSQEGQIYLGDIFTVTYRLRNTSPVDVKSLTFNINTGTGLTVIESPTITEIGSQSEVTAILKMRADRAGTAAVEVAIAAYGTQVQEDKFTLSISERPIWLQSWFLPVVAVIAALVIVGLILYRRRAPKAPSLVVGEPKLPSKPSATCPRCGSSLTFVETRSKYYCTRCKEYV
jgi:ribosomal protein S27AE